MCHLFNTQLHVWFRCKVLLSDTQCPFLLFFPLVCLEAFLPSLPSFTTFSIRGREKLHNCHKKLLGSIFILLVINNENITTRPPRKVLHIELKFGARRQDIGQPSKSRTIFCPKSSQLLSNWNQETLESVLYVVIRRTHTQWMKLMGKWHNHLQWAGSQQQLPG